MDINSSHNDDPFSTPSGMKQVNCTIDFHPSLRDLLHPKYRHVETINHRINYNGSVKDVIESLRVPHTEVGKIMINGQQVFFSPGSGL